MPRISEEQVVRELRTGDRHACHHLVDLYQDLLTGEGLHVFRIPYPDVEELVNDTLFAVVQNIGAFRFRRGEGDFHCWVLAIFRNRIRDFIRRRAREGGCILYFDESALENEDEYSKTEHQVVATILRAYAEALRDTEDESTDRNGCEARKKLEAIEETLAKLEPWERVLLRCRALQISFEEIAGYTGKTVAQLKVYHGRVKKKFIRLLSRKYPELDSK